MSEKYSFKELYAQFGGSGEIDSKYWVIGIEPGGGIANDKKRFLEACNEREEALISYFNDYSDKNISMTSLFNSILVSILKSNKEMSSVVNEVNGKVALYYTDTSVYRTNLFMLSFRNDNQELLQDGLKHYSEYIGFEPKVYLSKYDLYENYLPLRAKNLKKKVSNKNSERVIFVLARSYENLALNFLGIIFDTEFSLLREIRKSDLYDLPDKVIIKKYMNSSNSIKIYSFPQNRRLGQETITKAIQILDAQEKG